MFNVKEKQHIEDTYHPTEASQPTWELEGWLLDHFKNLGLEDENNNNDEQYISKL